MVREAVILELREPAPGKIGAEIRLSLQSPLLSDDIRRRIKQLVYRYKLVVMRGMSLTTHEYVEFARNFGEPQIYFQPNYHHPEHPEIFVSANVPYKGEKFGVSGTGRYWHTDYQFFEQPLPFTMLYPQAFAPSARDTSYIDMQAVFERLPTSLRQRVEGIRARHDAKLRYKVQAGDIDKSIAELLEEMARIAPPTWHPAVIEHSETGCESLYLSPGFTVALEGLSHEANQRVLAELFEFITRPEHIHSHLWSTGDILLWDNRTLLHKASDTRKGEPSVSYRIGIYDGLPFYRGLTAWQRGNDGHFGHSNDSSG
jgi:taurine dioxygenase